jgi:hypothetical protein
MRRVKNDLEGFGPNPADGPVLDPFGFVVKKPLSISSVAERGRSRARGRVADSKSARRTAIRKFMDEMNRTGNIPASPTK